MGRSARHEEHDDDHDAAALAEQDDGGRGWREAGAGLIRGHLDVERERREAERGGERHRDGEPDHAAQEVALVRRGRARRDCGLPVGLVDKHRAKVADDVDDAEHKAVHGEHGDEGAAAVVADWAVVVVARAVAPQGVVEGVGVGGAVVAGGAADALSREPRRRAGAAARDGLRHAAVETSDGRVERTRRAVGQDAVSAHVHLVSAHGETAPGSGCAHPRQSGEEGEALPQDCGRAERLALLGVILGALGRLVSGGAEAVERVALVVARDRVHVGDEDHEADHDDGGVDVRSEEGGLEAAKPGVEDHSERDKEVCGHRVHARAGRHHRRTALEQHASHDEVGADAEEEEGQVGCLPPADVDHLEESVHVGRLLLDLDGEDAKEEDLDRCARGVPKGTCDAVLARLV